MAVIVAPVVALFVSMVATRLAMAAARHFGVLDHPGELKVQDLPIPYLGGVGVAAALVVAVLATSARHEVRLLIPVGLALALGAADDVAVLSPWLRLAGELAIGGSIAWLVPVRLGWAGFPLVIIAVVVLINGLNMIDGLDGLAAGVTIISALGFAVVLAGGASRTSALALAGAVLGFLVWNRPPARIYLGDGGSYLLGAALACLLALAWRTAVPLHRSVAALALVIYPAGELALAVVRRLRAGQPIFAGDRAHLYDQLVDRGRSEPVASLTCIGLQAAVAVPVLIASQLGSAAAALAVGACAGCCAVGAVTLGFIPSSGAPGRGRAERQS
jgi:UDP-GlcNAc:undecaprenyl-phosphate GlcNAc-1-phosphate transferase